MRVTVHTSPADEESPNWETGCVSQNWYRSFGRDPSCRNNDFKASCNSLGGSPDGIVRTEYEAACVGITLETLPVDKSRENSTIVY